MFPSIRSFHAQGPTRKAAPRPAPLGLRSPPSIGTPARSFGVSCCPWLIPSIYGDAYKTPSGGADPCLCSPGLVRGARGPRTSAAIICMPRLQSSLPGLSSYRPADHDRFDHQAPAAAAAGVSAGSGPHDDRLPVGGAPLLQRGRPRPFGGRDERIGDVREPLAEVAVVMALLDRLAGVAREPRSRTLVVLVTRSIAVSKPCTSSGSTCTPPRRRDVVAPAVWRVMSTGLPIACPRPNGPRPTVARVRPVLVAGGMGCTCARVAARAAAGTTVGSRSRRSTDFVDADRLRSCRTMTAL